MAKIPTRMKVSYFSILFLVFAYVQSFGQPDVSHLNSRRDEQAPVLHPSGTLLYFTRANDSLNVGGRRDKGDIWVSSLIGNTWDTPVNAGRPLNNKGYNAVAGFSQNGEIMFLHHKYNANGDPASSGGLSYSILKNDTWSKPKPVTVSYFLNKSKHQSGTISQNNRYLIISSESYRGRGEEDIYVCFYDGIKFSEPKNLGSDINTPGQEMAPFIASDGKTLFFSSNGHGGLGGRDLFKSTRLDDTWTNWTAPENLGPAVNSDGVEMYFFPDSANEFAYYTSTRNSDGYGDFFLYTFPEEMEVEEPEVFPEDLLTSAQPMIEEPRMSHYSGQVFNNSSKEPINAVLTLEFTDHADSILILNPSSGFEIGIPDSVSETMVSVKSSGFMPLKKLMYLDGEGNEWNFYLEPLEVGTTIQLDEVYFFRGKAELIETSFQELNQIVEVMIDNPDMSIELRGHTDNQGDSKKNMQLSKERVQVVKSYLVEQGVSNERIEGKGYGGTRPIASNASEETRQLNRRVEFVITSK